MDIEPIVQLAMSIKTSPGPFAFILGSGVSESAGVPTGQGIAEQLVLMLREMGGEVPTDDPDYSKLIEALAPNPTERRNLLERFIEPSCEERHKGLKKPTTAHRAVASLIANGYVSVIITTNFDRLIESAITDTGLEPTVVKSSEDAETAIPLAYSRVTVIKVNGDYKFINLKNTINELEQFPPAVEGLLDEVFNQLGLVICGWSAKYDMALRDALFRQRSRQLPVYWLHREPLQGTAEQLKEHLKAIPVEIESADYALSDIADKLDIPATHGKWQQTTAETVVEQQRSLLLDPLKQIELHELMKTETEATISPA